MNLWATRILRGCRAGEMVSEMPFMPGRVTLVVALSFFLRVAGDQ